MKKRYVITGIGIVSPYGIGLEPFWQGIKGGESAVRPIKNFDGSGYPTKVSGEVSDIPYKEYGYSFSFKRMPRISQFSLLASDLALNDAGFGELTEEDTELMGVYLGTRNGALEKTGIFYEKVVLEGPYRSAPLLFQETVFNSIAAKISLKFKITGPSYVTPAGETGTLAALDLALLQMEVGRVNRALVGGADEFCEVLHQGHCHLKITATDDLSRPFDEKRTGLICSEGAAIIVVEELTGAMERGANIYGEIIGLHTLNDQHRVADNDPQGINLARCMELAMQEAGLEKVDCLVTTANGNRHIDQGELAAIKKVFTSRVPIANIKSLMGDTGGAGGGMNIAAAVMMLRDQTIPAIANLENIPEGYDFVLESRTAGLETVMVNAAGFGGNNFSLIIKKY